MSSDQIPPSCLDNDTDSGKEGCNEQTVYFTAHG